MSKDVKKMDVLKEDQDRINQFSKLNMKYHELQAHIKAKKKTLEDLEDAENELMLSDEDNIRYVIGECFVTLEKDEAEEKLQDMSGTVKKDVKDLEGQVSEIQEQMKQLKALLYGKFGNSINLEE